MACYNDLDKTDYQLVIAHATDREIKFSAIYFKYVVRHEKMQKFLPISFISAHIQFHLKQKNRSFSPDIHVNQCKVKQSNSVEMVYYNIILGGFIPQMY